MNQTESDSGVPKASFLPERLHVQYKCRKCQMVFRRARNPKPCTKPHTDEECCHCLETGVRVEEYEIGGSVVTNVQLSHDREREAGAIE